MKVNKESHSKSIKIEFASEWEAEQFTTAVELNRWVKFSEKSFNVADPKDGTPVYTDLDKLIAGSCQPIYGKIPELLPRKPDADHFATSLYVQHICGYDNERGGYERRFKRLLAAGFSVLRSLTDEDGKYWEIWYLYNECGAQGPIKGMKLEEIVRWLYHEIGPGNVSTDYKRWALGCPD